MKFIPNSLTRTVARKLLIAQKNSPHIMFAAGVVGVVGGTVLACRATLKAETVLDNIKEDVEGVKQFHIAEQQNKDLAYVYTKGSLDLVKLYAPAIVIGGASIALLTGSHVTLTRRNTALTAAYAGLSKAYSEYRDRVREELGEQRELDIYHSAVEKKALNESGKQELVKVSDPNTFSPYARFFDEGSQNWVKNSELNRLFVQCQQTYANHLLQARGHVFLNEVYDMLGIERSSAGQVVGWIIGDNGDNYIDFGMFEAQNANFINGAERSILLDFNVDGVIYDKL